jgi:multidrug efflux pump subunit AcrB
MVLVFLRDWRSVLVVVLNIPLALMGALVALWATGQTINLMTLGGLVLAVGFSMITSYLLSSMFAPVVSVWLLRNHHETHERHEKKNSAPAGLLFFVSFVCFVVIPMRGWSSEWSAIAGPSSSTIAASGLVLWLVGNRVGTEIFRNVDSGQFQLRLRSEDLSAEDVEARVADLRLSFEPADIVNEVMSFGSPTPVEVVMYGPNIKDNLAYADKVRHELERVPALRDLQVVQAQNYPTIDVNLKREEMGKSGVSVGDVTRSLVAATSSSRYVVPNYWADLTSGNGYQVQVQIPTPRMNSPEQVGLVPVKKTAAGQMLLRDVADVTEKTAPGEYDRFNLRRLISLTANIEGSDLGHVSGDIQRALERAGPPPRGVTVDLRGQVAPMREMFHGLAVGLGLSVLAIFLLLMAYFQSPKLALVSVAAVPAVLAGVAVMLWLTHTTLNIRSFMGAIMATGVAVANAILLVTFAERHRQAGAGGAVEAAVEGAQRRLRPILMTSLAMLAGMVPMALALGEGGEQTAPLGRAVIGGLVAATFTTLLVLPAVFAAVQGRSRIGSLSLDPADPDSPHYRPEAATMA